MADRASRPSVPDILRRTSRHLDALADEVHHIENAIGEDGLTAVNRPATDLTRLQRLDYLRQSLEDLALLSQLMSEPQALQILPEVSHKLRLSGTRLLLQARPEGAWNASVPAQAGDVEFF